jgi:hypothetical protein
MSAADGKRNATGGKRRAAAGKQNAPAGERSPAAGEQNAAAGEPPAVDSPGGLRVLVAALVFAEAAALIGAAGLLLVLAVTSSEGSPVELISLAAIAVIVGGGLALCGRGVLAGLPWTRGPVLTWQLLQAAVGAPLTTTGVWWAGVPLLASAVVVGVLIAGRHVIPPPQDRF